MVYEKKYNIFYTDDDRDDQEVFREVIAEIDEDVNIFTQNNGAELLAMLHNPPPQPTVIFLDLNMPVKNGYDVLREIRRVDEMKGLPIIVFSTDGREEAVELTRSLGASLYIRKPEGYDELRRIMKTVLSIDWNTFKANGHYFYNN